ncbi:MAG: hypothetical protein EXS14_01020 [Planctomycetes bacterium]|nr:hypothetical protein [Planctomycetota bacterium]
MRITYVASIRGKKMYAVTSKGEHLFTGAIEEVQRFIEIHNAKIRERGALEAALLQQIRAS